ncbi:MAG: hypothetical protein AAF629_21025 [Chloroflexota bacterium]
MQKEIAKGLFYTVATVLVLWTGSLTYSFVRSILPEANFAVPLFALVVFDVGMIAWLKVFIDYAEGSGQRAVALATCIFDFLGVGLMVLAELFLGGQTLTAAPETLGEYALWGIGVWTVVNVGSVVAFHLLDPEARKTMALRTEMDAVFDESLKKLKDKRAAISGHLSDQLSDGMLAQLMSELATDANQDGIPDRIQGDSLPATPLPQPNESGKVEPDFLANGSQ